MLVSSQKMVNNLLNTPKIEEIQGLLNTAKSSVTWYGKRIIQIPNFKTGRICATISFNKFISKTFSALNNDLSDNDIKKAKLIENILF